MAKDTSFKPYQKKYGADFPRIKQSIKELLALCQWEQDLKRETEALSKTNSPFSFIRTLQKKQILFDVKAITYHEFYHTYQDDKILAILKQQAEKDDTANTFLSSLREAIQTKKAKIKLEENNLRHYSWCDNFITAPVRFFTNSLHYQLSSNFFAAAEELSHTSSWRNWHILRATLSDKNIRCLNVIGANLLMTNDYWWLSRKAGLEQQHAISLANNIFSDITPFLNLSTKLNINETTMVKTILPLLKNLLTLKIILAFTLLRNPGTLITVITTCAIYIISQFGKSLISLLITPCLKYFRLPKYTAHLLSLLGQVATAIGSNMISRKITFYTLNNIKQHFEIRDTTQMQAPPPTPQERIGLQTNASCAEIKARCNQLTILRHPDKYRNKNAATNEMNFIEITQKCRFLKSRCNKQTFFVGTPEDETALTEPVKLLAMQ